MKEFGVFKAKDDWFWESWTCPPSLKIMRIHDDSCSIKIKFDRLSASPTQTQVRGAARRSRGLLLERGGGLLRAGDLLDVVVELLLPPGARWGLGASAKDCPAGGAHETCVSCSPQRTKQCGLVHLNRYLLHKVQAYVLHPLAPSQHPAPPRHPPSTKTRSRPDCSSSALRMLLRCVSSASTLTASASYLAPGLIKYRFPRY